MTENNISQLKERLIIDVNIIEQKRSAKQNTLYSKKIYIESPTDRRLRELAEEIDRNIRIEAIVFIKKLEKENEKIKLEFLEKMKKEQEESIKYLHNKK